jgi:hypothetical protein
MESPQQGIGPPHCLPEPTQHRPEMHEPSQQSRSVEHGWAGGAQRAHLPAWQRALAPPQQSASLSQGRSRSRQQVPASLSHLP